LPKNATCGIARNNVSRRRNIMANTADSTCKLNECVLSARTCIQFGADAERRCFIASSSCGHAHVRAGN
jgi:hypothetical protein